MPAPLEKTFPYEYVGGGYYRRKGVKKGEKADTLHGDQVPKFIYEALTGHPAKKEPVFIDGISGGTLLGELHRTAEMLVEIAEQQGVYYVVALLSDSEYDLERLRKLMPILEKKLGARKKGY